MGLCCMFTALVTWIASYWRVWLTIFILQGCLGVYAFEWAWKRTERARKGEEEMFKEFPSFRRVDTHLWSRSKFYPGCFFLLIPRLFGTLSGVLIYGFLQNLCYIGHPDMDVPLSGWKRKLHLFFTWMLRWTVIGWYGLVVDVKKYDENDTDYSKYLGPDWKKNKFKGKRVSTMVSNHIGFLEIVAFMSTFELPPAFVAAHFIRNFPIGRSYISALQGIYANRASG